MTKYDCESERASGPHVTETRQDGHLIFADVCPILAPTPIHLPPMGYFALKR